jgi:hypothetical protein
MECGREASARYTAPADNTAGAAWCGLAQQQLSIVGAQDIDFGGFPPAYLVTGAVVARAKRLRDKGIVERASWCVRWARVLDF